MATSISSVPNLGANMLSCIFPEKVIALQLLFVPAMGKDYKVEIFLRCVHLWDDNHPDHHDGTQ
eukprot:298065-Amphidinium_carterae.1